MLRVRPPSSSVPFDLAQLVVEATLRGALPPEDPEILRFLGGLGWRFEQRLTPVRAQVMADEVRRCFGGSARETGAIVREAADMALQARLEHLVVPRMSRAELDQVVRADLPPLTHPTLLLFAHAGNPLLLVAALAARLPGLVVFGERPAVAGTRLRQALVRGRRADEDRLPIRWESDPHALPAWLARGHPVAAAFDDRGWSAYARAPFLGREALLSPEPFALGVAPSFVSIHRERDKSSRVVVTPGAPTTLRSFLTERAEPMLRAAPGHYAAWLADRRIAAGSDDHPLFVDYATDDRWRRWPLAS